MNRNLRLAFPSLPRLAAAAGPTWWRRHRLPPSPAPIDAQRSAAATATATTNPKCSVTTLGIYCWEIGDANGTKVSGLMGAGAPEATTALWVLSSSKWL